MTTTLDNQIAILLEVVENEFTHDWEQFFDIDKLDESLSSRDEKAIAKHFQTFLSTLGLEDTGFQSYSEAVSSK